MEELLYTDGPWEVDIDDGRPVINAPGKFIATANVFTPASDPENLTVTMDEASANAHLMSAAPDMLAVIAEFLDFDFSGDRGPTEVMDSMRAALLKAIPYQPTPKE